MNEQLVPLCLQDGTPNERSSLLRNVRTDRALVSVYTSCPYRKQGGAAGSMQETAIRSMIFICVEAPISPDLADGDRVPNPNHMPRQHLWVDPHTSTCASPPATRPCFGARLRGDPASRFSIRTASSSAPQTACDDSLSLPRHDPAYTHRSLAQASRRTVGAGCRTRPARALRSSSVRTHTQRRTLPARQRAP